MTVTIKDIANYAGVSVGTVSKVLNNQGKVKEDLRIRVQAVIDKFNYRPSSLARGMKINKTNTIGLIIPKISNTFYVQIIELIEKEINERQHTLLLGNSNEDVDREIRFLTTFSNMRVDGVILASTGRHQEAKIQDEIASYQNLNIPVVLISRRLPHIEVDTVELENKQGAYEATRHLIENGHRRIGIISSSTHTSAGLERIEGYMQALEEYRIPYESALVHQGGLSLNSGYGICRQLMALPEPPSALFVGSNFQLLGTLQALQEKKVEIPEDISLICFDDTRWSSFANPPLTVIEPDAITFSKTAVDMLFDRIDGAYSGPFRRKRIQTKLVARKSVKMI
jgi:LacI family transcriptional regulator